MTRELRQAHEVVSGDADTLTVRVLLPGATTPTTVTWECGAAHPTDSTMRRCTRTAGGSPELVIDRVVNGARPVFEYDGTPTATRYLRATVIVPARGDRRAGEGHQHEIVLADGVYMRNRDA